MSPGNAIQTVSGPPVCDPADALVRGTLGGLARLLRGMGAAPALGGGPEQELRLTRPQPRVLEAVSSLARTTGGVLVAFGRRVARVFSPPEPPSLTREVHIPGPPALVPTGRRVYAVGDVHGRADLLVRLLYGGSVKPSNAAEILALQPHLTVAAYLGDRTDDAARRRFAWSRRSRDVAVGRVAIRRRSTS